jgi:hypothetical protein
MNPIVSKFYKSSNDIFGLPQQYKGVKFYPIKIKDIELKEKLYRLFFNPKQYIPDKNILKTSYFKFLLYVVQYSYMQSDPETDINKEIIEFFRTITKVENIQLKFVEHPENENEFDKISLYLFVDDIQFDEQDFDNIREILLEQNGSSIEYVESYQPSLEKKLEFMNRDTSNVDLKDEIFSFCALTGLPEADVGEKTLYQFKSRMDREMLLKDYELFKPLEFSGQVSSKNKEELFKHYMSHIPKQTRYGSILIEKNKYLEQSGLGNTNADGNIST